MVHFSEVIEKKKSGLLFLRRGVLAVFSYFQMIFLHSFAVHHTGMRVRLLRTTTRTDLSIQSSYVDLKPRLLDLDLFTSGGLGLGLLQLSLLICLVTVYVYRFYGSPVSPYPAATAYYRPNAISILDFFSLR